MRHMRDTRHIQEHAMRTLYVQALHEYTMGIQQHAATVQGLQHVQPGPSMAYGPRDRQTLWQGYSATHVRIEQTNQALTLRELNALHNELERKVEKYNPRN